MNVGDQGWFKSFPSSKERFGKVVEIKPSFNYSVAKIQCEDNSLIFVKIFEKPLL